MNKYHLQGALFAGGILALCGLIVYVVPQVVHFKERERLFPVHCTYAEYTREGLERVERDMEQFPEYLYCEDEYDFGVMKVIKQ